MLKSDLIERLTLRHPGLRGKDMYVSVQLMQDAMIQALLNGHRVEIRGFGVFEVNHRRPRVAHNPKTGERFHVGSKYVPHFRPGKELRGRVKAAALRGETLPKVQRRRRVA